MYVQVVVRLRISLLKKEERVNPPPHLHMLPSAGSKSGRHVSQVDNGLERGPRVCGQTRSSRIEDGNCQKENTCMYMRCAPPNNRQAFSVYHNRWVSYRSLS